MNACFVSTLVLLLVGAANGQSGALECPPPWISYSLSCYRFSILGLVWQDAQLACQKDDAYLVAIDDQQEHLFIKYMLREIDNGTTKHIWYTGGRKANSSLDISPAFEWVGVGPLSLPEAAQFWTDVNSPIAPTGNYIVYAYIDWDAHRDTYSWLWLLQDGISVSPYICEVRKVDAGKILSAARDLKFGVDDINPKFVLRGPYFVQQPISVVYDRSVAVSIPIGSVTQALSPGTAVAMKCDARGYPPPSYSWMRVAVGSSMDILLSSASNYRYVSANGRLTIYAPQSADGGQYYCIANNSLGAIRSSAASLTFQQINEFPRDSQTYTAQAFNYFIMPCKHSNPPSTRLTFFWYINQDPSQYIDPIIYPHIFISSNGNLYFSYVTTADKKIYNCQASLEGSVGLKRTSPAYTLRVGSDTNPITVPVRIDYSFPQVFPTIPFIGDTVRLECWARGTAIQRQSFNYRWSRDDLKALPRNSVLSDWNRVYTIYNAQYEDQGVYRCSVLYNQWLDSRAVTLTLQSLPFFGQGGLLDKHADAGADITWNCIADGNPAPTYSWLKNNQPFAPPNISAADRQRISFSSDMTSVRFKSLDAIRDPGMYQCAATNVFGTTYSSAQLRVLVYPSPPKFQPSPVIFNDSDSGIIVCESRDGTPAAAVSLTVSNARARISASGSGNDMASVNLSSFGLPLSKWHNAVATCVVTNQNNSNLNLSTDVTINYILATAVLTTASTETNDATLDCSTFVISFPNARFNWSVPPQFNITNSALLSRSVIIVPRGISGDVHCIATNIVTLKNVSVVFIVSNTAMFSTAATRDRNTWQLPFIPARSGEPAAPGRPNVSVHTLGIAIFSAVLALAV